jgi:hypothetical protein
LDPVLARIARIAGALDDPGGVQQGVVLDCRARVVPGILKKIERMLAGERVFKKGSSPSGDAPRAHGQIHTVL